MQKRVTALAETRKNTRAIDRFYPVSLAQEAAACIDPPIDSTNSHSDALDETRSLR